MADGGMHSVGRRDGRGFAYKTLLRKDDPDDIAAKARRGLREAARGSRWTMDVCGDVEPLELAATPKSRLRGMLFRDPDDVTRLLIPCHDIHTYGMRYPLDVAFISRDGKVLEVHRNVSTMRRIRRKDASIVAERFSKAGDWLEVGDVIHIGAA